MTSDPSILLPPLAARPPDSGPSSVLVKAQSEDTNSISFSRQKGHIVSVGDSQSRMD